MASEGLHEPTDKLKPETVDTHRAIVSLMEELEAVDWYNQRVDATQNGELRAILAHNRDEEKEHASMVLEWLRRHDATFEEHLKEYLFTTDSIVGREAAATGDAAEVGGSGDGSLGIGSLKGGATR
jgi:ferritin-like protein